MRFRVNRNLLKLVIKHEQGNLESYRLYMISRAYFAHCSGIFGLDSLCDILHKKFDYRSLHRKAGNKRGRFRKHLVQILDSSILFRQLPNGNWCINGERPLLEKYKNTSKSTWYEVPDCEIMQSKRLFYDFCMGMLLAGNRFRANSIVAKYCKRSVRRIQYATSRNHKKKTFRKTYNFADVYTGNWKDVERIRAELFNIHGITSPKPGTYKHEHVLKLNLPNSYRTFVSCGVKGFSARPTGGGGTRKSDCWFEPVRAKDKQLKLFGEENKRWTFKEGVYSFNAYIQDHSRMLNNM